MKQYKSCIQNDNNNNNKMEKNKKGQVEGVGRRGLERENIIFIIFIFFVSFSDL